jgi:hypothetical protein
VGSRPVVVKSKILLCHLSEAIELPGIGESISQSHLMPRGCLTPVDLPLAGCSSSGGFFKVVEVSSNHDVIHYEVRLGDFLPERGPISGGVLTVNVDYG